MAHHQCRKRHTTGAPLAAQVQALLQELALESKPVALGKMTMSMHLLPGMRLASRNCPCMLTLSPTTRTLGASLVCAVVACSSMLTHHGVLPRAVIHTHSEANVVTSANDALLGMGQPRSSTSAAEPASRQSPSQADNRAKARHCSRWSWQLQECAIPNTGTWYFPHIMQVTRQDVQALVAEARVLNNRLVQVLQALQTAGVEH